MKIWAKFVSLKEIRCVLVAAATIVVVVTAASFNELRADTLEPAEPKPYGDADGDAFYDAAQFLTKFGDLPIQLGEAIFSSLQSSVTARCLSRQWNGVSERVIRESFKNRFARIERLLELDRFIELPRTWESRLSRTRQAIRSIGVSQELWFEVMGNNPSHFSERKFCQSGPDLQHQIRKRIHRDGTIQEVPLCPDLPVDRVRAKSMGEKNSSDEFVARLNELFRLAKRNLKFRPATREEYDWADTAGWRFPKRGEDPDLWKVATYFDIANLDPRTDPDLGIPLPSRERQTHGVHAKEGNVFGFKRNSVWEWSDPTGMAYVPADWRALVGGSFSTPPKNTASAQSIELPATWAGNDTGPGRLVSIEFR